VDGKMYIIVDWSEGWATPWELAIEERRLKPSHPALWRKKTLIATAAFDYAFVQKISVPRCSEKHPVGTEINHLLW